MNQTTPQTTAIDVRNALAAELSADQLHMLAAWLGLESIEQESDEIFRLGKTVIAIAEMKEMQG